MNELEELEQEGLDEELLKVAGPSQLPNVPSTQLPAAPGWLLHYTPYTLHPILKTMFWSHSEMEKLKQSLTSNLYHPD